MKCSICKVEIKVSGSGDPGEWVEVTKRDSAYLGDHTEIIDTERAIYCSSCYDKRERRILPLEQLQMLKDAIVIAKCSESGQAECDVCEYRTGKGEFECLSCRLDELIEELEEETK